MQPLQRTALEREKTKYLKNKGVKDFSAFPIFEFKDDGVYMEILNEGNTFIGKESHVITYEQFNDYIKDGLDKGNMITKWDEALGSGKELYDIQLPPRTVMWEVQENTLTVREKIGGTGFYLIEGMQYQDQSVKLKTDYGSIYEVETVHEKGNHRNEQVSEVIHVTNVYKFTGKIYQLRKEDDYTPVPYLKDYLTYVLENHQETYENYLKNGMDRYFKYLEMYEHDKTFLEEIKRVNKRHKQIDWTRVRG